MAVPMMGAQPNGSPAIAPGVFVRQVPQPTVSISEVLASVETLYRDELKPYGRILRKRIGERALAAGLGPADVDIKRLQAMCESCPWLCVQNEEGGDWSALIRCRPATFVDVYSPQDAYPAELWAAAAAYFESLDESNMVLPGGRYSCAQVLVSRQLRFLTGRSLGQVCHIVQLAISLKKLLGYLNGAVVPYSRSQSMVKERCAERQRPCTSGAQRKSTLANWDTARACLKEILSSMPATVSSIPLSNVKRLFRSRFHIELSETALGYAKLSELLQDPHLRDVCTVQLRGNGYVIVPLPPPAKCKPISLADTLSPRRCAAGSKAPGDGSSLRERAKFVEPLSLEDIATPQPSPKALATPPGFLKDIGVGGAGQTIFPPTPSPSAARALSLPTLLGSGKSKWETACQAAGSWQRPPDGTCGDGAGGCAKHGLTLIPPGNSEYRGVPPWVSTVAGTAPGVAVAEAIKCMRPPPDYVPHAPQPQHEYCGVPQWVGTVAGTAPGVSVVEAIKCARPPSDGAPHAPQPQPPSHMSPAPPALAAPAVQMLTPSTLGNLGFSVHNTFIHAAVPPPTPVVGSFCRAHSAPRLSGSDQDAWQAGGRMLGWHDQQAIEGCAGAGVDRPARTPRGGSAMMTSMPGAPPEPR